MLRSLFVNIVANFFINHISAFKWLKDLKYVVHNYMDYFSDANHHTESRQYGRANYDFKKNVFIIFDVVLRHLVAFYATHVDWKHDFWPFGTFEAVSIVQFFVVLDPVKLKKLFSNPNEKKKFADF